MAAHRLKVPRDLVGSHVPNLHGAFHDLACMTKINADENSCPRTPACSA